MTEACRPSSDEDNEPVLTHALSAALATVSRLSCSGGRETGLGDAEKDGSCATVAELLETFALGYTGTTAREAMLDRDRTLELPSWLNAHFG